MLAKTGVSDIALVWLAPFEQIWLEGCEQKSLTEDTKKDLGFPNRLRQVQDLLCRLQTRRLTLDT